MEQQEFGVCKKCGKDLFTDYGDLDRRTSKNMCGPGSLMTEAIERSSRTPSAKYCKYCLKTNRKDKIQRILSYFKK